MTDEIKAKRDEQWLSVGRLYKVSNFGRIKSSARGPWKILNPGINSKGYRVVCLYGKSMRLHRVIALAFKIIKKNDMTNHIDGDKLNNHISNLERSWPSHNIKHAFKLGLKSSSGLNHSQARLNPTIIKEIKLKFKAGRNKVQLGKEYGVSETHIRRILLGKAWSAPAHEPKESET